ncbi:MAG: cation:proton antiporter [Demequina sp.]
MGLLPQIILILGLAVAAILVLQRLHVPSTIAYLLVGVALGPGTLGPVVDRAQIEAAAEFGIVFLLFTIGLSFSLPQIRDMRRQLPLLGTGQVVLTTAVVGLAAWAVGLDPVPAFVVGAVFAQSSTTIISKQLAEQGEENGRSGRLGLAMSVFQDVTAVPFVVVIPVLGVAASAGALAGELGVASAKAALAVVVVFIVGRRLLRPLFHLVARRGSAEMFTLTVLFVILVAAWTTDSLGLSLAFGAFIAGMTLGETEFRHSVEATIRPFRDVLLGLFFVAIGMLFEPATFPSIWLWAVLGAAVLVLAKTVIVAALTYASGLNRLESVRTGLVLSVGGEFGLALLAIALTAGTIDTETGQIALTAVLLSMIAGTFLIRYNRSIAQLIVRATPTTKRELDDASLRVTSPVETADHVLICGYGRIGQSVAHLLDAEDIAYVAVDLDVTRVREARAAGEPVYYGDAGERELLDALGVGRARLVVVAHDDVSSALKVLAHVRLARPDLPVMVRTRDEAHVAELQDAGAFEVVPETLEAGLAMASQALLLLDVPVSRVAERMQQQRDSHYRLMREFFRGEDGARPGRLQDDQRIRFVSVPRDSPVVGLEVSHFEDDGVTVAAVLRAGRRRSAPHADTPVLAEDVVVLHGSAEALDRTERKIHRKKTRREKT